MSPLTKDRTMIVIHNEEEREQAIAEMNELGAQRPRPVRFYLLWEAIYAYEILTVR